MSAKKSEGHPDSPPLNEGKFHQYRRYRTHSENGLCVLFDYAGKKLRPTESSGNLEDHFKLPLADLPRRVFSMMAKNDILPTESWKAMLDFETEMTRIRAKLESPVPNKHQQRHSQKTIDWLLSEGLEKARTEFYAGIKEFKLGKIKDGVLVFHPITKIAERAQRKHQQKLLRIEERHLKV